MENLQNVEKSGFGQPVCVCVSLKDRKNEELELRVIELEQYTRKNNIELHRVVETPQEDVEEIDTSVQQTVSFRCRVNKRSFFGGASTNGSFSEARQQTARFRWRLNKPVKSFFDIFKLISDS